MTGPAREPNVPFVWPSSSLLDGQPAHFGTPPFRSVFASADRMLGLVSRLDASGVEWLVTSICSRPELIVTLVLALQPAGPTRQADLEALREVAASRPTRVSFRIVALDTHLEPPGTLLALLGPGNTPLYMATGPTPNFGIGVPVAGHGNLVFAPDPLLFEKWCAWFDQTWERAIGLNADTARIPLLILPAGSPQGAALWDKYRRLCETQGAASPSKAPVIDPHVQASSEPPSPSVTRSYLIIRLSQPLDREAGRRAESTRIVRCALSSVWT